MKFKRLSVGNMIYGTNSPADDESGYVSFNDPAFAEHYKDPSAPNYSQIHKFLLHMAVCHSVLIFKSMKDGQEICEYNASSPDELAFVNFVKKYDFEFINRTANGKIIIRHNGVNIEYDLLQLLEFTSTRKRMSVIIRDNGRIKLLSKGADNIIFARLEDQTQMGNIVAHLKEFASYGLRTLVLGERNLTEEEYKNWAKEYNEVQANVTNTEAQIESVREKIENNLLLVGASAIEDKLQDCVPETIDMLKDAGIKFWVLTGDKLETAKSIAKSSGIIKQTTYELSIENYNNVEKDLNKITDKIAQLHNTNEENDLALFLSGEALPSILEEKKFKKIVLC
jgi:phospholipid-transporting ATPase